MHACALNVPSLHTHPEIRILTPTPALPTSTTRCSFVFLVLYGLKLSREDIVQHKLPSVRQAGFDAAHYAQHPEEYEGIFHKNSELLPETPCQPQGVPLQSPGRGRSPAQPTGADTSPRLDSCAAHHSASQRDVLGAKVPSPPQQRSDGGAPSERELPVVGHCRHFSRSTRIHRVQQ